MTNWIVILMALIVVLQWLQVSQLSRVADNQRYDAIDAREIASTFGQHLETYFDQAAQHRQALEDQFELLPQDIAREIKPRRGKLL